MVADRTEDLAALAARATYGGNPEHKRNPRDFALTPPSDPRQGKSLCDDADVLNRDEAGRLLSEGLRRGMVSVREKSGWPRSVWAVTGEGIPVEGMLENSVRGAYHGYPLPKSDPLYEVILREWGMRS